MSGTMGLCELAMIEVVDTVLFLSVERGHCVPTYKILYHKDHPLKCTLLWGIYDIFHVDYICQFLQAYWAGVRTTHCNDCVAICMRENQDEEVIEGLLSDEGIH